MNEKIEKVSGYFDSKFEMDLKWNSYTSNEVSCFLSSNSLYLSLYVILLNTYLRDIVKRIFYGQAYPKGLTPPPLTVSFSLNVLAYFWP